MSIRIKKGNLLYIASFLLLVLTGISSVSNIAGFRHWFIGKKLNEYIEDARFISKAERPLIITDFSGNKRMVDFLVVIPECGPDNIDILRVSADINYTEYITDHQTYSEIYTLYTSDELLTNLKAQFGPNLEKMSVEGISSIWKIIAE